MSQGNLLFEQYLKHAENENIFTDLPPDSLVQLTAFLSTPSKASLESVISDEAIHGYISRYMAYCTYVRSHGQNCTVVDNLHGPHSLAAISGGIIQAKSFEVYVHTLNLMTDLFFSFG